MTALASPLLAAASASFSLAVMISFSSGGDSMTAVCRSVTASDDLHADRRFASPVRQLLLLTAPIGLFGHAKMHLGSR